MSKNKPVNFDEFWRDAVTQWERNSNELAVQNMESPEFAKAMTNLAIGSSGLQKMFAMFVAQSLTHMNLPSRTEMLDISERLRAIEASIAQIQAALANVPGEKAAVTPVKAKPARTKKPPARTPATAERAK